MRIKRVFFIAIILFSPALVFSQLITEFVTSSDRTLNQEIISFFLQDVNSGIEAVQALALREDPYITDILEFLVFRYGKTELPYRNRILYFLLNAFFDPSQEASVLETRITENKTIIFRLIRQLDSYSDYDIKIELIRLIVLLKEPLFYGQIVSELGTFYELMRNQNNELSVPHEKVVVELCSAAEKLSLKEANPVMTSFITYTTSKNIVTQARKAVKANLQK